MLNYQQYFWGCVCMDWAAANRSKQPLLHNLHWSSSAGLRVARVCCKHGRILCHLLIPRLGRWFLVGLVHGSKPGLFTNLAAVLVEQERNHSQDGSNAADEAAAASDAERREHLVGEERCRSTAGRSDDRVGCDSRRGILLVRVDEVVEVRNEEQKQRAGQEDASQRGYDPVYGAKKMLR